jgi:hypothetical protein
MQSCADTVAEALCIMGPERLEWEDRAIRYARECRYWELIAERRGWTTVTKHCSTMAAMSEQLLWRLT